MYITYKGQIITYYVSKTVITIKNSWMIKKAEDMKNILKKIRRQVERRGFVFERTDAAWLREWKAHNLMYNLNFKRAHTADVDLDENESAFRRFCYLFLSLLYIA